MTTAGMLFFALMLDALLGEPKWLWNRVAHPAVLMGRVVGWCDATLNRGRAKRAKGVLALVLMMLGAALLGGALAQLGGLVTILIAAILLAQKSLVQHVRAVANGLRRSLADGKRAVAMIVSRDTGAMQTPQVARAAIESAAENLSDGVIAPAFWFLIAGLPGLIVYKIVNTADSMIGYRTPRYADFGWAAARMDDLLNLVPARLAALLIALAGGVLHQWPGIRADAALHRSPNAGWPEAAMARALGVALAGPRAYDGKLQDFAWVNGTGAHQIGPDDIDAAADRLWQAWGVMLALTLVISLLTS